ncbi:MAG: hypothetical protein GVY16_06985 [Planctomycetes bacterium]|jgi:hypothetical protein|nr:hypothetical protein [Planctomycetota bacterium]
MKEAVIREKLLELVETISTATHDEKQSHDEGIYVSEKGDGLQEVIDQLRMHVTYMMFDLEASRREGRYLRQMLEMRPPQARRKDDTDNEADNGWR